MTTPNPIPPTVGRIVLVPIDVYQSTHEGVKSVGVEIRPAIVVRVFNQDMVNVRVFTDGANDHPDNTMHPRPSDWRTSLSYDQDDHRPGTWHWMPYQMQAAAKPITAA
jgi:hypothetical protein